MEFPLNDFLSDLEFLINIDSSSSDIDGCFKIAKFFESRFAAAGMTTELSRQGAACRPVLVAEWDRHGSTGGEPVGNSFLMCGHMDTVFPTGTAARRPFRIEEDKAYGPGTVDMKAGALLMLYLSEFLIKTHPEKAFKVFLNSDEEIGSPDSLDLMRETAKRCKAIFVFEGARKKGQFVNQRKGIAKYKIDISGIASHSGTAPKEGVSAIVELANWILAIDSLKNYAKGTTLNIGLIEGGCALNTVAPKAEAMLEVRYADGQELSRIDNALKNFCSKPFLAGTNAEVLLLSHFPPLTLSTHTTELMKKFEPLGLSYVSAGGISDANRLACLDIPIIDGCGPGGGFPHSEKEFLSIPMVLQRFETMLKIFELI